MTNLNQIKKITSAINKKAMDPLQKYDCTLLLLNINHKIDTNFKLTSFNFPDKIRSIVYRDSREDSIVYNYNHSPQIRNFSIAHALGHYYLHLDDQAHFIDFFTETEIYGHKSIDVEANYFAAHLLLPDQIIYRFLIDSLNFFDVLKQCKITFTFFKWRLTNFLLENYTFQKEDAEFIVNDFIDYSNAALLKKGAIHQKFSLIFSIEADNFEKFLTWRKEGKHPVILIRDSKDRVIGTQPHEISKKEPIEVEEETSDWLL